MLSQYYYTLRSRLDGQYLVARLKSPDQENPLAYLLVFKEDYDALSYLNTHAADFSDRFGVESVSNSQLKGMIQRWGFKGLGMVQDPLEPRVDFVTLQWVWAVVSHSWRQKTYNKRGSTKHTNLK